MIQTTLYFFKVYDEYTLSIVAHNYIFLQLLTFYKYSYNKYIIRLTTHFP
jgi:hypothetical protein